MSAQDPWQTRSVDVWPPPPEVVNAVLQSAPKPPVMGAWKAIAACILAALVATVALMICAIVVEVIPRWPDTVGGGIFLFGSPLTTGALTALFWRRANMTRLQRLIRTGAALGILSIIGGLVGFICEGCRHGLGTLGYTALAFALFTPVTLVGLGIVGAILRRIDRKRASAAALAAQSPPTLPPYIPPTNDTNSWQ